MGFTRNTDNLNIIQALADLPNDTNGLTSAQFKEKFDEGVNILKTFLNEKLISELESTSGASNMGARAVTPYSGETVQAILDYLKREIDGVALGEVPDYSILINKLSQEVINRLLPTEPLTKTTTLSNSMNIIDVEYSGLIKEVKSNGLTLINLLGKDGNCEDVSKWYGVNSAILSLDGTNKVFGNNGIKITLGTGTTNGSARIGVTLDVTKYYLIYGYVKNGNATQINTKLYNGTSFIEGNIVSAMTFTKSGLKIQPSNIGATNYVYITVLGTETQYAHMDGVMVKEITSSEYTNLTVEQLMEKYPYVDSVQHTSPALRKWGKNVFDKNTSPVALVGNATIVINVTGVTVKGTPSGTVSYASIPYTLIPNTQYTLQSIITTISGSARIAIRNSSGGSINILDTTGSVTFTTDSTGKGFLYFYANQIVSTGSFEIQYTNVQLELGSTATTFEPYNEDYLYPYHADGSMVKLASNVDRSVCDVLDFDKKEVLRKFKQVRLDGSLGWTYDSDYTGYKRLYCSSFIPTINHYPVAVKYNGKILSVEKVTTKADSIAFNISFSSNFQFSISDTDSGWGETYIPLTAEQSAYFNGWKMNNGTFGTNYNGTGTKTWIPWGATDNTNAVTTVPTTPSTAITSGTYDYYRLTYQLASPATEPIEVEGSISTHDGLNQFQLLEGVVVREKANPVVSGSLVVINWVMQPQSQLKYRTGTILHVYKEDNVDEKWDVSSTFEAYGSYRAVINLSDFDSAADYYVTYIVLDKYKLTSNAIDTDITYSENVLDVLYSLVDDSVKQSEELTNLELRINSKIDTTNALVDRNTKNIMSLHASLYYDGIDNPKIGFFYDLLHDKSMLNESETIGLDNINSLIQSPSVSSASPYEVLAGIGISSNTVPLHDYNNANYYTQQVIAPTSGNITSVQVKLGKIGAPAASTSVSATTLDGKTITPRGTSTSLTVPSTVIPFTPSWITYTFPTPIYAIAGDIIDIRIGAYGAVEDVNNYYLLGRLMVNEVIYPAYKEGILQSGAVLDIKIYITPVASQYTSLSHDLGEDFTEVNVYLSGKTLNANHIIDDTESTFSGAVTPTNIYIGNGNTNSQPTLLVLPFTTGVETVRHLRYSHYAKVYSSGTEYVFCRIYNSTKTTLLYEKKYLASDLSKNNTLGFYLVEYLMQDINLSPNTTYNLVIGIMTSAGVISYNTTASYILTKMVSGIGTLLQTAYYTTNTDLQTTVAYNAIPYLSKFEMYSDIDIFTDGLDFKPYISTDGGATYVDTIKDTGYFVIKDDGTIELKYIATNLSPSSNCKLKVVFDKADLKDRAELHEIGVIVK